MEISNKKTLEAKLVQLLKDDWQGKKGYLSNSDMFKYCQFYTGNFWNKIREEKKKVA